MKIIKLLIITFFIFLLAPKTGWATLCDPNDSIFNPNPASVSLIKNYDSTDINNIDWYLYEFTVTNNLDTSCIGTDIASLLIYYPNDPNFQHDNLPANWDGNGGSSYTWGKDIISDSNDPHDGMAFSSTWSDLDLNGDPIAPITPQNSLGGFSFKLDKDNGCTPSANCNPFNFEFEIGFVGPSQATYTVLLSSTTVPEPTSLLLLGLGIASISLCGRFRFSRRKKL